MSIVNERELIESVLDVIVQKQGKQTPTGLFAELEKLINTS
jgi:hypothetical protein